MTCVFYCCSVWWRRRWRRWLRRRWRSRSRSCERRSMELEAGIYSCDLSLVLLLSGSLRRAGTKAQCDNVTGPAVSRTTGCDVCKITTVQCHPTSPPPPTSRPPLRPPPCPPLGLHHCSALVVICTFRFLKRHWKLLFTDKFPEMIPMYEPHFNFHSILTMLQ